MPEITRRSLIAGAGVVAAAAAMPAAAEPLAAPGDLLTIMDWRSLGSYVIWRGDVMLDPASDAYRSIRCRLDPSWDGVSP